MQLDQEFIKWVIAQAIGLILAAFIFQAYRQLAEQLKALIERSMTTTEANTASNAKIITLIEGIERNAIRKSDIEAMMKSRE